MKYKSLLFAFILIPVLFGGCKINYSMSGAATGDLETVSVQFFPNRAPIVNPTLSSKFTEALRDKIQSQTSLTLVNGYGDANFEGEIKDYSTKALAITGNDAASKNRFTVTVRVKYTNKKDNKLSFDTQFSRNRDVDATLTMSAIESQYLEEILDELVEDAFNKAFVNW